MSLVTDRQAQLLWGKAGDTWYDTNVAEQRTTSFYEVVTLLNDEDMETDLGRAAEIVDMNLEDGLHFYRKVSALMSAFATHVSTVGGYSTLRAYFLGQRWRMDEYAAERCWADGGVGTDLLREYVFAVETAIASKVQAGALVDIGDLPSYAGPARMRCGVTVKGAAAWTPVIQAVCEGPESTLDGTITDAVTTIVLADASRFPAPAGCIMVDAEAITYTGNDGTDLTGCTRNAHGTVAAAHTTGTTVYKVHEYQPVIRGNGVVGLEVDLAVAAATGKALAGTAEIPSSGIEAAGWQVDAAILLKDHSAPELLIANCNVSDEVHVADTSAFTAGDYVRLHDDTPTDEWATILRIERHDGIIYLDAATAGNFAMADNALICLAFTTINEGALFSAVDVTLTVDDPLGFPTTGGTLRVGDEEMTYGDGDIIGNDITVVRGQNGTTATAHEDLSPVLLVQQGTYPGHNEWHDIATVNADDLVPGANLLHTYWLAASFYELLRDVVVITDGAGGNAGDTFIIYAVPDRDITKAD